MRLGPGMPGRFRAGGRMQGLVRALMTAALAVAGTAFAVSPTAAQTAGKKPNILMIMGDDIGWFNPSIYHRGMMGFETPNIDRIGKEGAIFMTWYGQQSCTAGRAAFITGQSPIRTGLTKVGLPGATEGLQIGRASCRGGGERMGRRATVWCCSSGCG